MNQSKENIDTKGAAKTGVVPTFLVAIEHHVYFSVFAVVAVFSFFAGLSSFFFVSFSFFSALG